MYSIEKFVCRLQKENRVLHTIQTRTNPEIDAGIVFDLFIDIMLTCGFWSSWKSHVQRIVGAPVSDALALQGFFTGEILLENKRKVLLGESVLLYRTHSATQEHIVAGTFWYYVYLVLKTCVGVETFVEVPNMKGTDDYYQDDVYTIFIEKLNKYAHSRKRVNLDFVRVMRHLLPQIQYLERRS